MEETKRHPIYTEAQTGNGARQRTRPTRVLCIREKWRILYTESILILILPCPHVVLLDLRTHMDLSFDSAGLDPKIMGKASSNNTRVVRNIMTVISQAQGPA